MAVGGGPLAVIFALFLAAALAAGGAVPAPAAAPRESAAVSAAYAEGELLVTLNGEWEPALREVCRAVADGRRMIRDEVDDLVARQAELPAPFLVRLRLGEGWGVEQARRLLERLPAVEAVEPNYLYRKSETVPNDPNYGQQWNLRRIGADLAWDVTQGSDTFTLAVIDTGLDYGAPEFAGRCVSGWDFINNDPDPYDDEGHGTGVTSVAAAATDNANLIAGITWRGKIMPLKALDSHGVGKTDAVAQSIYYAVNHGAKVINMSFTGTEDAAAVRNAVSFAAGSGCLMTAAVGNEGTSVVNYPAAYPDVIGVGSVDFKDNRSGFSNHNATVDLVAPGEYRNAVAGIPVVQPGNRFGYTTGTSIASPHVAGAAMLVWSDQPSLSSQEVWEILRDSARDLGGAGWDEYYGFGRLDVFQALSRIEVTIQTPDPYSYEPTGNLTASAESLRSTLIRRMELRVDGETKDAYDLPLPASPCTHTFTAYDFASLAGEGGHRVEVVATDTDDVSGTCTTYYYFNQSQPRPSTTWYLAEGTTAWGFDTWVLIQNPNSFPVTVGITYMKPDGSQARDPQELPPLSRTTIHVNAEVWQSDVSTYIEAVVGEVVAERAVYWNGRQAGHASVGVNGASQQWYLAEGTTAWGFEEWVLVQNPASGPGDTAHVTLRFMRPDGTEVSPYTLDVGPGRRQSVSLNRVVPDTDLSVKVESDRPVVAERAMYWNDRGGGHGSNGVTDPSRTWYLAEGTTAWGFEEWVLVQNPQAAKASVEISFLTTGGQVVNHDVELAGNSRFSLNVADVVGEDDVSTFVYSDIPVVAERAMYWNGRTEGHACVGSATPANGWCLSEGTTAWGFEEWVLLQNPTDRQVQVTLTCMLPDGSSFDTYYDLSPFSRTSVDMGQVVGSSDVSVEVRTDGYPVVVERAMYWDYRRGGTVAGGVLDPK
jgi:hypothetical protein